jgi:hypothetical protein
MSNLDIFHLVKSAARPKLNSWVLVDRREEEWPEVQDEARDMNGERPDSHKQRIYIPFDKEASVLGVDAAAENVGLYEIEMGCRRPSRKDTLPGKGSPEMRRIGTALIRYIKWRISPGGGVSEC